MAALLVAVSVPRTIAQIGVVSEQDLRATVEKYLAAFSKPDIVTMDRMETDDFVFVQDGSVVTKAQQMASFDKSRHQSPVTAGASRQSNVRVAPSGNNILD